MNPVLATVVPVCVALPALPHNHPLVPQLYPTQRLHSLGALSSSWLFFLLSPPTPSAFPAPHGCRASPGGGVGGLRNHIGASLTGLWQAALPSRGCESGAQLAECAHSGEEGTVFKSPWHTRGSPFLPLVMRSTQEATPNRAVKPITRGNQPPKQKRLGERGQECQEEGTETIFGEVWCWRPVLEREVLEGQFWAV